MSNSSKEGLQGHALRREEVGFTPGPWSAGPSPMYAILADGKHVAITYDGTDGDDQADSVCAANARLIAAAPDLLQALRHTKQFVLAWIPEYAEKRDRDSLAQMQRIEAALNQIDAALAKAGA